MLLLQTLKKKKKKRSFETHPRRFDLLELSDVRFVAAQAGSGTVRDRSSLLVEYPRTRSSSSLVVPRRLRSIEGTASPASSSRN